MINNGIREKLVMIKSTMLRKFIIVIIIILIGSFAVSLVVYGGDNYAINNKFIDSLYANIGDEVRVLSAENPFDMQKILDNGPDDGKVILTIMGDGFTENEQNIFMNNAQIVKNSIINQYPFSLFSDKINIYAIKVISKVSGVSDHNSKYVGSYFESTFYYHDEIARSIYIRRTDRADALIRSYTPNSNMKLILANSDTYGGTAVFGQYAVCPINNTLANTALHELGHSFGYLKDEYWDGRVRETENMTYEKNPENIKWKDWLGYEGIGIYPYTENPNLVRPHQFCKMQYSNRDFCAVCSSALIKKLTGIIGEKYYGKDKSLRKDLIKSETDRIVDTKYYGCNNLETVIIPQSVNTIGKYAFLRCTSLQKIYNYSEYPQLIDDTVFAGVDISNVSLYVPKGKTAMYQYAGWHGFKDIIEVDPLIIDTFTVITQPKLNYESEQILDLDGLSVNAIFNNGEELLVSYKDFNEYGIDIDMENYTKLNRTQHSGKRIVISYLNKSTSTNPLEIETYKVEIPRTSKLIYNGKNQRPAWAINNKYYTVDGIMQASNIGTYTTTLTIRDTYNFEWNNSESESIELEWEIIPRTLWITNVTIEKKIYDGTNNATVTNVTLEGFADGESLVYNRDFTAMAEFDNKDAGGGKNVQGYITLEGTNLSNQYVLNDNCFKLTNQSIDKANITAITVKDYSVTELGINLDIDLTNHNGEIIEYAITSNRSIPKDGWTSISEWTDLTSDSQYYIYARIIGNENYNDYYSEILSIRTLSVIDAPKKEAQDWVLPLGVCGVIASLSCVATGIIIANKRKKRNKKA